MKLYPQQLTWVFLPFCVIFVLQSNGSAYLRHLEELGILSCESHEDCEHMNYCSTSRYCKPIMDCIYEQDSIVGTCMGALERTSKHDKIKEWQQTITRDKCKCFNALQEPIPKKFHDCFTIDLNHNRWANGIALPDHCESIWTNQTCYKIVKCIDVYEQQCINVAEQQFDMTFTCKSKWGKRCNILLPEDRDHGYQDVSIFPCSMKLKKSYSYMNYDEIVSDLARLADKYPEIMHLINIEKTYNMPESTCIDPNGKYVSCFHYLVKLTEHETLTPDRPQLLLIGSVHGDEKIGTVSLVALIHFLIDNWYAPKEEQNLWLKYLISNRNLIILPVANAYGYDASNRYDKKLDPNRDFPHHGVKRACFQTQTSRVINEIFRGHLIQGSIAFHEGSEGIGYPWGDRTHQSWNDAPDNEAFKSISKIMANFGGPRPLFYKTAARLSEWTPRVDGTMDDWAYGGAWMDSKIKYECAETWYDGSPRTKTNYSDAMLRSLHFTVEIYKEKMPIVSTLGTNYRVLDPLVPGHVSRTIRLSLVLADLLKPYIVIHKKDSFIPKETNTEGYLSYTIGGAVEANEVFIRVYEHGQSEPVGDSPKTSIPTMWNQNFILRTDWPENPWQEKYEGKFKFSFPGTFTIYIVARVDANWGISPNSHRPQSHVVNARYNKIWNKSNAGYVVKGQEEFFSEPTTFTLIESDFHEKSSNEDKENLETTIKTEEKSWEEISQKYREQLMKEENIIMENREFSGLLVRIYKENYNILIFCLQMVIILFSNIGCAMLFMQRLRHLS